ncbi:MAG: FAD-binding oxidoreductase [Trebonia sp.]
MNAATTAQRIRQRLDCPVEVPGDSGYEGARRVWNGDIDRHPAVIVHPRDEGEIAAALRLAATEGLEIAVRGGGHSFPGLSVCDGGLVISLDLMRAVTTADGRQFHAQGGALLGDLDTAAQARGRVVPSGVVSHTGIAGLTLGGGYGYLARNWGLSCDNLRSVRLVRPDGQVVEVDDESEPELMFGLRGGGGNFGIASEFRYDSHPLGQVLSGWILHPFDRALDFARFYRDFAATMPDQLFGLLRLRASGETPFLPRELRSADRAYIGLEVVWSGDAETGLRLLEPLRAWGRPACDTISAGDFCTLQRSIDSGARHGVGRYERSGYLAALTDEMLSDVLPRLEHVPSNECETSIITLGGRIAEVGEDETAYSSRSAPFQYEVRTAWSDPADRPKLVDWTRETWSALNRHATGGVYVNLVFDEGGDRVKTLYGARKYERLARLKAAWDPDNLLHLNQNISPLSS